MTKDTDTEKCIGQMEVFIKANGVKVFNMGMGRCISLTELKRLVFLRTTCLRAVQNRKNQFLDLHLNQ